MPIAYGTFSTATQYRLEVTSNIIGWDGVTLTTQTTIGIRRVVGSGGGITGTIPVTIGSETASGGIGDTTTFSVNFGSTNYVELTSNIVNESSPAYPWNLADTYIRIFASTTAASAPAWGNATASVTLDIPAPSQATWPSFTPSSFAAGTLITISLPRVNSTYTHDVFYSFGSVVNQPLATGVATSMTTTPPTGLLSEIPNASAGPYTITAITRTASGSEVGRRSYVGTLTVPSSSVPTVSAYSVSDTNTTVATEVGAFVQGLSVLKLNSITATASLGATIDDRRLSIEGSQLRVNDTRALLNAGTIPLTARAWDSRGLEGALSGSINVMAYTAPGTDRQAFRSTAAGVADKDGAYITIAGTNYIRSLINGTQRNAMTIRVYTKLFSATTWTARNVITPTTVTSGDNLIYSSPIVVSGGAIYDPDQSYSVRMEVSDKFNTITIEYTIATAYIAIELNGQNVGVGKLHERGRLDVGGATHSQGLYSIPQLYGNANNCVWAGQWATAVGTTTNLPTGVTGYGFIEVVRTRTVSSAADAVIQRYVGAAGGPRWTRVGLVNTTTEVGSFDPWTVDATYGMGIGPTSEMANVPNPYPGMEYNDTTTGLKWVYRGSSWFVAPGQMLAYAKGTTTVNVVGTALITTLETPVLAIGQPLNIITSAIPAHHSAAGQVLFNVRWLNSATNVTSSTGSVFTTRVYNPGSNQVISGPGQRTRFVTTAAAKVSANTYLASAGTFYGPDGFEMWIESA